MTLTKIPQIPGTGSVELAKKHGFQNSTCMKSVSSYDLIRLFVGSEGTLGVIAEITLKIRPHSPVTSTAINCLTACVPGAGKIPLVYETDREAIENALMTLLVSTACLPELEGKAGVVVDADDLEVIFGDDGNLISGGLGV
ncbi:MAG: hypothetical protein B6240_03660 [Desulfobacteraceae bacterium 4572_87]|nr:MAG: hypothetical protein B6240_03660 [Desulfobacteraceae bacterium 4572_87]